MMRRPDQAVNLDDFSSALYELQNDLELAQELIAKERRTKAFGDHMRAVMQLSNLEIKMTNFAKAVRDRFA